MANTVLPLVPKDLPCDAPTSFFISCVVPYIPSFAMSGGNSGGLGECNKTVRPGRAHALLCLCVHGTRGLNMRPDAAGCAQDVAMRVLPALSCAGDKPDLNKVIESLSTIALAESGGRSVFINPAQYGLKAPGQK